MPKKVLLAGPESATAADEICTKLPNTEVVFADTFEAAVELMKVYEFDIIFTDALLPGGDGRQLLLALRDQKWAGKAFVIHPYNTCFVLGKFGMADWNIPRSTAHFPFAKHYQSPIGLVTDMMKS